MSKAEETAKAESETKSSKKASLGDRIEKCRAKAYGFISQGRLASRFAVQQISDDMTEEELEVVESKLNGFEAAIEKRKGKK